MELRPCCRRFADDEAPARPRPAQAKPESRLVLFARKGLGLLSWFVPSAVLVLMPKCPLCFAAYVSVATGLGLSLATATYLRTGLIAACTVSLGYLAGRLITRSIRRGRRPAVAVS